MKKPMKRVSFTNKIEEGQTFHSFSAATMMGDEYLGAGNYTIEGKGGIRLRVVHPSIKENTYVREIHT